MVPIEKARERLSVGGLRWLRKIAGEDSSWVTAIAHY